MRKQTFEITLRGLTPILFDRYAGNNNDKLKWQDKVYLSSEDGKTLVFPAVNLQSFLSAQNTESAPQRVCGKKWRTVAKAAQSYVTVGSVETPFTRNGDPLTIDNAGLEKAVHVARLKKGQLAIPNLKERPMLRTPWELSFTLDLLENNDLSETTLRELFEVGGTAIGLGTFRGVFGKFQVASWK